MNIERRIQAIEDMIAEIHAVLVLGREPAPPGVEEYLRALQALETGDKSPLTSYLKRGGKVPKAETILGTAAMQRGPARRRANLPPAARIPVQALRGVRKELRKGNQ
jgi:hypothetical protein